jgi:hypothetical protein
MWFLGNFEGVVSLESQQKFTFIAENVYDFFMEQLKAINENVDEIKEIDEETSGILIQRVHGDSLQCLKTDWMLKMQFVIAQWSNLELWLPMYSLSLILWFYTERWDGFHFKRRLTFLQTIKNTRELALKHKKTEEFQLQMKVALLFFLITNESTAAVSKEDNSCSFKEIQYFLK